MCWAGKIGGQVDRVNKRAELKRSINMLYSNNGGTTGGGGGGRCIGETWSLGNIEQGLNSAGSAVGCCRVTEASGFHVQRSSVEDVFIDIPGYGVNVLTSSTYALSELHKIDESAPSDGNFKPQDETIHYHLSCAHVRHGIILRSVYGTYNISQIYDLMTYSQQFLIQLLLHMHNELVKVSLLQFADVDPPFVPDGI
ncbi:hypothetical protein BDR04DRAFT_1122618 [Suillus decipiens]|nr:hypothetical protein BDR04DRAFT_1122618 [Suillus decipiens]